MDGPIWLTAAAGLGTGVGYLLNALRHRREEDRAEPTTLEQVGRELRRLGEIVEVRLAGIPEAVKQHGTAISILQEGHERMKAEIIDLRRADEETDERVRRLQKRLP